MVDPHWSSVGGFRVPGGSKEGKLPPGFLEELAELPKFFKLPKSRPFPRTVESDSEGLTLCFGEFESTEVVLLKPELKSIGFDTKRLYRNAGGRDFWLGVEGVVVDGKEGGGGQINQGGCLCLECWARGASGEEGQSSDGLKLDSLEHSWGTEVWVIFLHALPGYFKIFLKLPPAQILGFTSLRSTSPTSLKLHSSSKAHKLPCEDRNAFPFAGVSVCLISPLSSFVSFIPLSAHLTVYFYQPEL